MVTELAELEFTPAQIKRMRISLAMTQHQFCAFLGVSHNMVSRWELGRAKPVKGPVIARLCEAARMVELRRRSG